MTDTQLTSRAVTEIVSICGSVTLETLGDKTLVRCAGAIDANLPRESMEQLAEAVRQAARPVHVDCSPVTFFCAEGLSLLALLMQAAPDGHLAELVTNPAVDLVLSVHPAGTYTRSSAL